RATDAKYGAFSSEAAERKWPPFSGSPFHHSALKVKVPKFAKSGGAAGSHVNSYNPTPELGSNGADTVANGARSGKSNIRSGVPNRKRSALRSVVTNQSVVLSFVME